MPTTITNFDVPGISCGHCKSAIESAVGPAQGVERVEVDVSGRKVAVEHDAGKADAARLIQLIEDQGYRVEGFQEVPAR